MGGQNNWRTNITFDDWSRDVEKRILSEERRPIIRSAADLMGPGAGPFAIQTDDWNADETTFNGWFYSEPGALNSPDPTKSWIGTTEGDPNGNGYELVRSYDPVTGVATGDSYVRFFSTPPGTGQRIYSDWTLAGGGGSGGDTPVGPAGGDLTGTYPNPQINGVTFTFVTASTVWSLPHNLNKLHVQIYTTDNGLVETYGNVDHLDENNAEVRWNVAMTGIARVSA